MVSHHFKFKSTAAQRGSEREGGRGRNKEWLRERERKQGRRGRRAWERKERGREGGREGGWVRGRERVRADKIT